MENNNSRRSRELRRLFIIVIVILAIITFGRYFINTHFLYDTIIEDVPCTFLSIEQAIEKVNMKKGEEIVTFSFSNGKTYEIALKQFNVRANETLIGQIFEEQHLNPKESRKYHLDGYISVEPEMLRQFLEQIPELREENMIEPQNAYIVWDGSQFSIQKEKQGSMINFEEAIRFALEKIKDDEAVIDFTTITDVTAEILTEDLVSERDELNSILNSSIKFLLSDGYVVTLDANIIKNWIFQDENDKFSFDVENGVSKFVDDLAIKVNEANSYMHFVATDCDGLATVNVPNAVRAQLDKEKEISEIKSLLGNSETIYNKPIYDRELISNMLTSYIEIDLSRQHIWFYKDGDLIMDTDCVTGDVADGYSTPTGVFFLLNKNRKVYLEGYNKNGSKYSSFVEYWMRFNQGIGMHDAQWRYSFGGNIYLTGGSHGCVNMPKDAAATTYEHIDETMPIIVYKSNS